MSGVVELIDQAVDQPPGPRLAALLAQLPWSAVPNARLVEVLQARSRQLAHDQACLFAGMAEIARATPVAGLPDGAVARAAEDAEDFQWASHEIAAALTWTPTTADRELDFALTLRGLPRVFAALEQGLIDRGKAKVFCDHLDPARRELTPAQIRRLCEHFVPLAPRWTARQLSRRLLAAIQAIDPDYHRRRYRRGLRERGVVLFLNRDGTATLSGQGLPPDEAAAAAARLDRLAEAAKRAGHPGRLGQITADLYLGMLDGSFHGLTEAQILDRLLTSRRPDDRDDTDAGIGDTSDPEGGSEAADAKAGAGWEPTSAEPGHADPGGRNRADESPTGESPTGEGSTGDGQACPTVAGATGSGPSPTAARPAGTGEDRWRGERIGIRQGIELRVGLATVLGCDQRPAEIPGLGPIDAETARTVAARQRRGARWHFAILDTHGYLLLAGPLRRRPRPGHPPGTGPPDRVRGGVVELHLTLAELRRFAADPDLTGDWTGLIAEIADRWADRHRMWRELGKDPRARFARGALADHVRIRDRSCVGPGCDRPARRSQLDHTIDHGRGGDTVQANIGPGCWRHHPDKDRGWTLTQPRPGHFVWISPLGRTYRTRGEPIRPDLPDPDPPPDGTDRREDPDTGPGNPHELRILWREGNNPAPLPPPAPDAEEEPPF
ncbi:HNH endonuclease [Pseudonocardia sp. DSM 110487]|uniref:HNH endonuclease signature motif containing protein n=1 Tax=Pseudonocardia sp. DSM 110487 TaxID=2865833 RepID=UPI001C6A534F|nr:HNH endonuclease signature motif containing protein [Pseudonocardia sp. DSM 110487]QYN39578.1 HNH endonuclease [Pseudonocardia sp. DSM 110487]